jgi:hypothetical protein
MSDDKKVVELRRSEITQPTTDQEKERVRRLTNEVERLSQLSMVEWQYICKTRAEAFGITSAFFRSLVEAKLKETKTADVEQQRRDERSERQRRSAERDEARKQEKAEREEARKQEKDQRQIDKNAARKAKEKGKAFADIIKLPSDRQETALDKAAERLDENPAALRDEFAEYCSAEAPSAGDEAASALEPWSEPVPTAALLEELIARINRHIKAQPHEVLAIALWILMAWVHEAAAHYSVYLVATAPKDDCGKTTLIIEVVGRLAPKPYASGSDPTIASIFRTADREKPTMLFDNVDTLFQRKPEVTELFLSGWTRGIKYPRTEYIGGHYQTVQYDPFCPKACSLIGTNLPSPLLGRSLLIELWPLKPGEEVAEVKPFDEDLMDEFKTLRSKSLRWSNDNVEALKTAEPLVPAGFTTRPRANAKLLLAIAELGGANWAERARAAIDKLLRQKREPSWLELLLQELWTVFVKERRKDILSKQLLVRLTSDPISQWCEYGHGHGHKVTEREIAAILRRVHIHPDLVGKSRLRGYRADPFFEKEVFQHFLSRDPLILSSAKGKSRRSRNRKTNSKKKARAKRKVRG